MKFSKLYFREVLHKTFKNSPHVMVKKTIKYSEEWASDGHPTRACTEEMIRGLASEWPDSEIILNEDFITNENSYRGVEKCWLSGCSACNTRGYFKDGGFCTHCHNQLSDNDEYIDFNLVQKLSSKLFNHSFPDGIKRRHESSSSVDSGEPGVKVHVEE